MKNIILFAASVSILACLAASDSNQEDYERPCGYRDEIDKDCVRQFFEERGRCSVVTESNDEPVFKEQGIFYMPFINVTAVDVNSTFRNLDGPIREFKINTKTGNIIYSMKMENVKYYSPAITFFFYRIDEEPLALTDEIYEEYPHTVLTAVIPQEDGKVTRRSMQKATVSTFFLPEGNFRMELGPNITESDDPQVRKAIHGIDDQENIALKEAFVTEGYLRFLAYLQKHICDFDVPIAIY